MKTKIKIMETRPGVTDEEIRSQMNFEKLLEQREQVLIARQHAWIKWLSAGAVVVIVIIGATWLLVKRSSEQNVATISPKIEKQDAAIVDSIESDTQVIQEKAPATSNREKTTAPAKKSESKPDTELAKPNVESLVVEPSYVQAEPKAGYTALYDYFAKELHYPETAVRDSIQGVITVTFTINANGSPENVVIRNSLGKVFDDEAVRLIGKMPEWKAATLNGKPVASKVSLPLTFQIQKVKSN